MANPVHHIFPFMIIGRGQFRSSLGGKPVDSADIWKAAGYEPADLGISDWTVKGGSYRDTYWNQIEQLGTNEPIGTQTGTQLGNLIALSPDYHQAHPAYTDVLRATRDILYEQSLSGELVGNPDVPLNLSPEVIGRIGAANEQNLLLRASLDSIQSGLATALKIQDIALFAESKRIGDSHLRIGSRSQIELKCSCYVPYTVIADCHGTHRSHRCPGRTPPCHPTG